MLFAWEARRLCAAWPFSSHLGCGSGRYQEQRSTNPNSGRGFRLTPSIIMLVFLGHGPRPTIYQALALLFVLSQFAAVVGLRTTPGSPCEDVCHRRSTNTTSREMVCLDGQYNTTSVGSTFRECVSCQLGSNYTGEAAGESDVSWGLCMQSFKSLSHRI